MDEWDAKAEVFLRNWCNGENVEYPEGDKTNPEFLAALAAELRKMGADANAAYLKGLKEAQKVTARYKFRIGTLEYPNNEAVDAIQNCIDEAKDK